MSLYHTEQFGRTTQTGFDSTLNLGMGGENDPDESRLSINFGGSTGKNEDDLQFYFKMQMKNKELDKENFGKIHSIRKKNNFKYTCEDACDQIKRLKQNMEVFVRLSTCLNEKVN